MDESDESDFSDFCYDSDKDPEFKGICEKNKCGSGNSMYDGQGFKKVNLFCDGCSRQNKNSIVASMFMYVVNNTTNIQGVTLHFFEPNHGQSEGDSAHSAIGQAISQAGDLFVPSQLNPIIALARRKKPYKVHQMEIDDFFDFKELSKELRILTITKDNEIEESISWPEMIQWEFNKNNHEVIFFKTSHFDSNFRSLSLKRNRGSSHQGLINPLKALNSQQQKISVDKYKDLVSLCEGSLPVIRTAEFVNYYKSFPH